MNRKCEVQPRNTKPKKDLTGMQFGYLTPLYWVKGRGWYCRCKCGNEKFIDTRNLNSGHTTSCGCRNYETKNLNDLTGFETEHLIVLYRVANPGKQTKWRCVCKHCGKEFTAQANHLKFYQSCGCVASKQEARIADMLDASGTEYARQYTFEDLYIVPGHPLRFDFAVFKNHKLSHLIEFNGLQHYSKAGGSWADSYDRLVERDRLKLQYCKSNGIELRIIKYDDDYTIEDLI